MICPQGRLSVATVEKGMHTATHRRDRLFMHRVSNHGSFTALGGDLFFLFECFVLLTKILSYFLIGKAVDRLLCLLKNKQYFSRQNRTFEKNKTVQDSRVIELFGSEMVPSAQQFFEDNNHALHCFANIQSIQDFAF